MVHAWFSMAQTPSTLELDRARLRHSQSVHSVFTPWQWIYAVYSTCSVKLFLKVQWMKCIETNQYRVHFLTTKKASSTILDVSAPSSSVSILTAYSGTIKLYTSALILDTHLIWNAMSHIRQIHHATSQQNTLSLVSLPLLVAILLWHLLWRDGKTTSPLCWTDICILLPPLYCQQQLNQGTDTDTDIIFRIYSTLSGNTWLDFQADLDFAHFMRVKAPRSPGARLTSS